MIEQISKKYANQAIKGLEQGTVDKFEDAQIGNYASVFVKLSKQVRRKLLKQFSDDRIDKFTKKVINTADKSASKTFYNRVETKIGISTQELLATEALKPEFNALVLESAQWAQRLRDDAMEFFTANSLRMMSQGQTIPQILKEHSAETSKRKKNATFLARNQIQNFNSMASKVRAQNLGITKAIWITAGDERVRPCHQIRDGKEFELSVGLFSSCDGKTLLPGVDFNCRCTYEMIIPAE